VPFFSRQRAAPLVEQRGEAPADVAEANPREIGPNQAGVIA
jgi:hypothetical protein